MADLFIHRTARISACGKYRYALGRQWDTSLDTVTFLCLNPSTADADLDDPSVTRMIRFARDWGYGGLSLVNLFAYRATKPGVLKTVAGPVGPDNDLAIYSAVLDRVCVCAWGADLSTKAWYVDRVVYVREHILYGNHVDMRCLGLTKHRAPRHPLFVKADAELIPFRR